ncbi:MAG: S-layer homology domain-containing protein [Butyricicoccus sp.]
MEPSAGTQAYIAVGETSPSGGGMGGGPNGQGGGQGMTPPGDANGSADGTNGNRPTPPNFSGNTSTDGTFTPPTKPSGGNMNGGQQGGTPANRESALGIKEGSVITVQDSSGKTLYTATALGSMSSVIFSSADIKEGETYTVLVGGTSVGTAEAKLGTADSSSSNSTFKPGQGGQPNQNGSQATVGSFKDVPQNSWFASAVQYVTSNSLMNGTSTTAFSPSATMSRGMLMTVLARYAGESTEGGTVWYEKGMNWAKSKGVSDGLPEPNITREQLATMLTAPVSRRRGTVRVHGRRLSFRVCGKSAQWRVKNGILTGKTSSTLAPR